MNVLIQIWKNKDKIAEGIANRIFKKEHVEEIAAARAAICEKCEHLDRAGKSCAIPGTQPCCGLCGCSRALKTRSLSSFCDDGRWDAVMTAAQEDQLVGQIEGGE